MSKILEIKNLSLNFANPSGQDPIEALKGVNLSVEQGKTLGLVGESGSGKSVTSLAIMGLLPSRQSHIPQGEILFQGQDLLKYSEKKMRSLRGNKISMIFQEPMTSLNPVFTVGFQIVEALQLHKKMSKKQAWERAIDLLDKVGLPQPALKAKSYPHQLSGGQRQRVMIAMAIACEPQLLIADEPTTALDVTIQKQILELLARLQENFGMSMIFITHDLGVVGDIADQVVVMYQGEVVESGDKKQIFTQAQHPYTRGLLACRPSLEKDYARLATLSDFVSSSGQKKDFNWMELGQKTIKPSRPNLLEVRGLSKNYTLSTNLWGRVTEVFPAVNDVSFEVQRGHTLGLVGESGCGKSTLGRTLLRLLEPSSGDVVFDGESITHLPADQMRKLRRRMQIIFQDPFASLNPRMSVGEAIMEPMMIHKLATNKKERIERAEHLIRKVGLEPHHMQRFPHEFSGGQRQRVCIARALAVEPEFIICDESVSALDVSIQAQILNLLIDLQSEFDLTYIFISHDLAVVKFIADEIAVMHEGRILELESAHSIYHSPQTEYTKKLLASIPKGFTLSEESNSV